MYTRQPRSAFTLVEALVVLAIVGLLIGLLLPSLQKAHRQAMSVRCLSNVRQIGFNLAIYVHDHRTFPPAPGALGEPGLESSQSPAWFTGSHAGLLNLVTSSRFEFQSLVCPEGWASAGDATFYRAGGINPIGQAFMDYAYWVGRYPPADIRYMAFAWSHREQAAKILVTDVVPDLSAPAEQIQALGYGNHSAHVSERIVARTDGSGEKLFTSNRIRTIGASVLFSDFHAEWFHPGQLTQQSEGLCYPPPDQWR